MGAIASGGVRVLDHQVVAMATMGERTMAAVAADEQREPERRERAYGSDRPALDVRGKTVIVVRDGLATRLTMRAAALALRVQDPARIVLAVPVAAAETCGEFRDEVDDIVCAIPPEPFYEVGLW